MNTTSQEPTVAAFYLPQFHPIPENDEFWGNGFTEWRNVVQARPLFLGHEQPHIPADLGFYDLRTVETQAAQAALARQYGIGAFCYYHYWFNGRTVLGRPLQQLLAEPTIDLPFFVCWANENWTRRWDGRSGDVLLEQHYTPDDDIAHIRSLLPVLADDRYHRVDEKPVILIYRARLLPDPSATADRWRTEVARAGLGDLHLCAVESFTSERGDPRLIGFDAAVEFQPNWDSLVNPEGRTSMAKVMRRLGMRTSVWFDNAVYSYDAVVDSMMAMPSPGYPRYPCVTPRWDNTARRQTGAVVLRGSTPEIYGRWLEHALAQSIDDGGPLVFVNAWNEWSEGAHLEPDLQHGHSFLEATARVVARTADRRH